MRIGCPKEIKNNENRVGLTPNAAHAYINAGHEVLIETGAGLGSAVTDEEYIAVGAKIVKTADEIWNFSDMVVKVKEPLPSEFSKMREGQIIYTYFHFAADKVLVDACLEKKIIGIAYETVQVGNTLPLLKPMSEVAGRMSTLMGAFYSANTNGGRGLLSMGVTGVAPANVLVIGGGVVGINAARVAAGLGCNVNVLDLNLERLDYLNDILGANVTCLYSDPVNLENSLRNADIVVGAVLIPGAVAPKLVKKHHLALMKPGAIMVDVAIDQGGCFETSHPTSHDDPTFVVDGIVHYCVANMPGAYARTATFALNNATLKYGLMLANFGAEKACRESEALKLGLNVYKGFLTHKAVSDTFNMQSLYKPAEEMIK